MGRRLAIAGALLVAALVAVVAVLAAASDEPSALQPPTIGAASTPARAGEPPLPPRGALALAGQLGNRVVALAVQPRRLTVTLTGPDGTGVSGPLQLRADGRRVATRPCGPGCYLAAATSRPATVAIAVGGRAVRFDVPADTPQAASLLARIGRAYRRQPGVTYQERLASSPTTVLNTTWRLEAPNRISYREHGNGAAGIVLGTRRWDRESANKPWIRTTQSPPLVAPGEPWGRRRVYDVRLLERSASRVRVALVDPLGPVWYVVTADPRTLLPRDMRMTATAHFMHDRGFEYDGRRQIAPPAP